MPSTRNRRRQRGRRFWWHTTLARVARRGYVAHADMNGMRAALLAGNKQAQRLLRRECDRLGADAEALVLDLMLCFECDTEAVASAIVGAQPNLFHIVASAGAEAESEDDAEPESNAPFSAQQV